jgi:hypothetical protein
VCRVNIFIAGVGAQPERVNGRRGKSERSQLVAGANTQTVSHASQDSRGVDFGFKQDIQR